MIEYLIPVRRIDNRVGKLQVICTRLLVGKTGEMTWWNYPLEISQQDISSSLLHRGIIDHSSPREKEGERERRSRSWNFYKSRSSCSLKWKILVNTDDDQSSWKSLTTMTRLFTLNFYSSVCRPVNGAWKHWKLKTKDVLSIRPADCLNDMMLIVFCCFDGYRHGRRSHNGQPVSGEAKARHVVRSRQYAGTITSRLHTRRSNIPS